MSDSELDLDLDSAAQEADTDAMPDAAENEDEEDAVHIEWAGFI